VYFSTSHTTIFFININARKLLRLDSIQFYGFKTMTALMQSNRRQAHTLLHHKYIWTQPRFAKHAWRCENDPKHWILEENAKVDSLNMKVMFNEPRRLTLQEGKAKAVF